tara:strand:+ start:2101 stop:2481 length:381 start_codon:yes stop_codon:yes gene_type:complete
MVNNQLFKKIPTKEYINKILKLFGIVDFDENFYFSKFDIQKKNILDKINEEIPELEKYYLKCKAKKYLVDLNHKKLITILRQLVRQHKYRIVGFEKYTNGEKYLLYKLEKDIKIEPKEYGLIMNFD